MSSISGVSSSPTWLQLLQAQSATSTQSTSTTSSTTDTSATSATSSTSSTDATDATSTKPHGHGHRGGGGRMNKALEDQGISGSKLTDLRTQIDTALKGAKSDGTDPKTAIDGVLQAAGVNMDEFNSDMAPPAGGTAGPGGAPPTSGDSASTTSSTGTSSTSSASDILAANGLDPDQFQNSLMSMLNSGSTDTSSLFASAPIGSSLDIAA